MIVIKFLFILIGLSICFYLLVVILYKLLSELWEDLK